MIDRAQLNLVLCINIYVVIARFFFCFDLSNA